MPRTTTLQIEANEKPRRIVERVRGVLPRAVVSISPESHLPEVLKVFTHAVSVFGDVSIAERWLQERNRVLGGKKPIDLLRTQDGCDRVDEILTHIEHGVYS